MPQLTTTKAPCGPRVERDDLEKKYKELIEINTALNRQLVSNQANKETPFFRWFKFKEGFSRPMVDYFLSKLTAKPGSLLDPFAGAGSALFAAREKGWKTTGVELLPVGAYAIAARLAEEKVAPGSFRLAIDKIKSGVWKKHVGCSPTFSHINITAGAFPTDTEKKLHAYLSFCDSFINDSAVRELLKFAAYSILESISFTRKDGQYLRWDSRSGRSYASKTFNKGPILPFEQALYGQLEMMWQDLAAEPTNLFSQIETKQKPDRPDITLYQDSCLKKLRDFKAKQFDFILTSPPYCNRYDYTRTYALELVFLGTDEENIRDLRQAMLSCTVENREKVQQLHDFYLKRRQKAFFEKCISAFQNQKALQEVLQILENYREQDALNNPGIVRMVRNYFLEMSIIIHECARLMKPGAWFVMVNDNVSYNGEDIPVDLILSEFARSAGLNIERIWTLQKGKGNSSQQMGLHGRKELRKCVYLWRKPKLKSTKRQEHSPGH